MSALGTGADHHCSDLRWCRIALGDGAATSRAHGCHAGDDALGL